MRSMARTKSSVRQEARKMATIDKDNDKKRALEEEGGGETNKKQRVDDSDESDSDESDSDESDSDSDAYDSNSNNSDDDDNDDGSEDESDDYCISVDGERFYALLYVDMWSAFNTKNITSTVPESKMKKNADNEIVELENLSRSETFEIWKRIAEYTLDGVRQGLEEEAEDENYPETGHEVWLKDNMTDAFEEVWECAYELTKPVLTRAFANEFNQLCDPMVNEIVKNDSVEQK
jgi:hypothetical protein